MTEFDQFASDLLEESKRFLERANVTPDADSKQAFLHAALLLSFSSLEAHINAIVDDFRARQDFSVYELGLLLEREVRLENGEFVLGGLKMSRMEDRIEFLCRKFTGLPIDKQEIWWMQLKGATDLRNKLVHPKEAQNVTGTGVSLAMTAIISAIDALYRSIYKRPFPAANLGLQSRKTF